MKVWVLTGPVHCGKTTFLTGWCERVRASGRGAVHGVLGGPDDAAGRRHLTALPSGEVRRVQCLAPEAAALERARAAGTPGVRATVTVGAYTFFEDSMQWARDTLAREADALVAARAHGLQHTHTRTHTHTHTHTDDCCHAQARLHTQETRASCSLCWTSWARSRLCAASASSRL